MQLFERSEFCIFKSVRSDSQKKIKHCLQNSKLKITTFNRKTPIMITFIFN